MGGRRGAGGIATALIACAAVAATLTSAPPASGRPRSDGPVDPSIGIMNLDHLIFVVQENRSFDHYFGTFPGADGLPRDEQGRIDVCVPDPARHTCDKPYHDTNGYDEGGPHNVHASRITVDGGMMDGAVRALEAIGNSCRHKPAQIPCEKAKPGPQGQPDVMGYHTAHEIPNYWSYAQHFVLQDRMFAPTDSWTLPSHLYLVSAWSATCPKPSDPMSCRSDLRWPGRRWVPADGAPRPYAWADITWLLSHNGVSWSYYVGPGTCVLPPCARKPNRASTNPIQNPLPGFRTVEATNGFANIRPHADYFSAAADGTLPSVSWIMPSYSDAEHPPDNIGDGQAWVTKIVNAAMEGPDWLHTAIFITWDDWGGFYDHVKPIKIDENGYGIRVPGIMISPFAKTGIDHQTLSFDAYLKLIEDRFLGGQRLDPATDGWPDPRPTVREDAAGLGDLAQEFDFYQTPLPPLILAPWPRGRPAHLHAVRWTNG